MQSPSEILGVRASPWIVGDTVKPITTTLHSRAQETELARVAIQFVDNQLKAQILRDHLVGRNRVLGLRRQGSLALPL